MAWVKIDENFYDHPKWCDAPGDSIALWVAAMAWCNRNDSVHGFIPDAKVRGLISVKNATRTLADLCQREAFHRVEGGYIVHDYEEFQQPEKVKEIAKKRSVNGKKGAAARWGEHYRALEASQRPPHDDSHAPPMASAIANGMANEEASAMANLCPDTDSVSDVFTSERSSPPTDTPVDIHRRRTRSEPRAISDIFTTGRAMGDK